jgi:hypothetical protein
MKCVPQWTLRKGSWYFTPFAPIANIKSPADLELMQKHAGTAVALCKVDGVNFEVCAPSVGRLADCSKWGKHCLLVPYFYVIETNKADDVNINMTASAKDLENDIVVPTLTNKRALKLGDVLNVYKAPTATAKAKPPAATPKPAVAAKATAPAGGKATAGKRQRTT